LNLDNISQAHVWGLKPLSSKENHPFGEISFIDFTHFRRSTWSQKNRPGWARWFFILNQDVVTEDGLLKENTYAHFGPKEKIPQIRIPKNASLLIFCLQANEDFLDRHAISTPQQGPVTRSLMRILLELHREIKTQGFPAHHFLPHIQLLLTLISPGEKQKPCSVSFDDGQKIDEIIHTLPEENKRLQSSDWISRSGLPTRRTKSVCQSLYGMSPSKIATRITMERAMLGLLSETRSLEEIARFAGYGSRSNFITGFKKMFGAPPEQLRDSLRS
jgi:AraC-like DNA-binding protein